MKEEACETPQIEDISQQLIRVSEEMKELSNAYREARKTYGESLNKLTVMIYKSGLHNSKAAFENKIPMLIAKPKFTDEAIETTTKLNESQQEYKGLEQVLKAYQAQISGIQSVIKFMLQGEMAENVKSKYEFY